LNRLRTAEEEVVDVAWLDVRNIPLKKLLVGLYGVWLCVLAYIYPLERFLFKPSNTIKLQYCAKAP
jgi:hypothetical protein